MKVEESIEEFELQLSEYYDGDEVGSGSVGKKSILLKENSPDYVFEEIMKHAPDYIDLWEEKDDVIAWISENRDAHHPIYDSLIIGTTNSHDVEGDETRWVTIEFSGTYYELWHSIEKAPYPGVKE